jgi:hypothetical protein
MDLYDCNAPGAKNVVYCCNAWMGGIRHLQDRIGFPNFQRVITGVKTHWIEKKFISLKNY